MGRINRSYLGGFRVNPSPTYVTLVTILFHAFPNDTIVHQIFNNTIFTSCFSSSNNFKNFIFSNCTDFGDWNTPLSLLSPHLIVNVYNSYDLTAFSFRFCFTVLLNTLERVCCSLSSRYAGTAPCPAIGSFFCLLLCCSCCRILCGM